jgi:hypothetical protein
LPRDKDLARAALFQTTGDFRASQPEIIAQHKKQGCLGLNSHVVLLTIDIENDFPWHCEPSWFDG